MATQRNSVLRNQNPKLDDDDDDSLATVCMAGFWQSERELQEIKVDRQT